MSDLNNQADLAVILPEPEIVKIPRAGGVVEELEVWPLPFKKWKRSFQYISQIAPLFGFSLADQNLDDLKDKVDDSFDTKATMKKVFDALSGDASDLIISFLAFAVDKEPAYFDPLYEQIVDIAVAVVKVNLAFFVERLLPKLGVVVPAAAMVIAELNNPQPILTVGQEQ